MPDRADKSDQQKDAESKVQRFQANLGPFVVATETTRMAMVVTDATERGNPIIFANGSFLSLTGYAREEVLGQEFNFMLAHAADAETLAQVKAELEGTSDIVSEILYRRKDGAEFLVALFIMAGRSPCSRSGCDIDSRAPPFAPVSSTLPRTGSSRASSNICRSPTTSTPTTWAPACRRTA
jgi:PAS domain S-box-containing protein